jgi:pyruvate dehydrogenase E2 component (dihydrolipoamide acetyltransferase)
MLEATDTEAGGRVKASPLARKVAAELGVQLETLPGSGPGGRIVRDDVLSAHQNRSETVAQSPKPVKPAAIPPVPVSQQDVQIPLGGMRRTIAARLLEAKTTIPHFYLQAEVDAEPLVQLRQQLNAANEAAGLPKFTVNDFILKATAVAAAHVPKANASFSGDTIVQYGSVQLACAVAIDDGLVTPVIRDAQSKTLSHISAEIKDLASKARSKKLKPEQYQGGTLTVSNLGSYGVDQFFAIINPPQSLIVSVGAILKKPVINAAGAIVPGQRLVLALSCDHRVVDGAIGAQFLAELKRLLETPALMLV